MITLRLAAQEDIPAMLDIYRYYVENTAITFECTPPSLEEFTRRFERVTERFPWMVAEEEGRIAGYCYAAPAFEREAFDWVVDSSVYLQRDFHRRGIAKAFYEVLDALLIRMGYHTIYALITGSNAGSIAFHEAAGYRQVGYLVRSGYKLGEWHDVAWLEKQLIPSEGEPAPTKCFHSLEPAETECLMMQAQRLIR